MALKTGRLLHKLSGVVGCRHLSQHFPIDDHIFGLTDDQIQVCSRIFCVIKFWIRGVFMFSVEEHDFQFRSKRIGAGSERNRQEESFRQSKKFLEEIRRVRYFG